MNTGYKRATAPLDAVARARLWDGGGAAEDGGGSSSMELEEMVCSFYNDEAGPGGEAEDRKARPALKWRRDLEAELKDAAAAEPVAEWIRAKAEAVVRSQGRFQHGELLRRNLVRRLKELGFDAGEFDSSPNISCRLHFASVWHGGICISEWDYTAGIPAGSHEFIDVVAGKSRYIVEINLLEEFEIARPTAEYIELLEFLPKVFVGRPATLGMLIRVMCLASQESIRSAGMHMPPWRRAKYMYEKWLGADYRRLWIDSSPPSNLRGRPAVYRRRHACRANTLGTKDYSKVEKGMFLRGSDEFLLKIQDT
ncbi:hypothetical protein KSP40_PGU012763 [Platanthera guangdongensis]|uniref:Uncharacterized protein n=1 Tax=Platanthera guangdongensis TaxID=2320717 RepID=A0ABR2N529_9ASPA